MDLWIVCGALETIKMHPRQEEEGFFVPPPPPPDVEPDKQAQQQATNLSCELLFMT